MITFILALNGLLCLFVVAGVIIESTEGGLNTLFTFVIVSILILGIINFIVAGMVW